MRDAPKCEPGSDSTPACHKWKEVVQESEGRVAVICKRVDQKMKSVSYTCKKWYRFKIAPQKD